MNVIVTGSRDLTDRALVYSALDDMVAEWSLIPDQAPLQIIEGGCRIKPGPGADLIAKEWCQQQDPTHIKHICMPANWSKYGPSAGPRRNIEMLTIYHDAIVLAFPQGASRGTRHCIREAEKRGMPVMIYES